MESLETIKQKYLDLLGEEKEKFLFWIEQENTKLKIEINETFKKQQDNIKEIRNIGVRVAWRVLALRCLWRTMSYEVWRRWSSRDDLSGRF